MAQRVRFHADFRRDLAAQLTWLQQHRDDAWIERLRTGLDEAIELLSALPRVGTIEAEDDLVVLRRLILRKLPYVVWYTCNKDDPKADIWFLRLFHASQDRPQPTLMRSGRRRSSRKT